MNKTQLQKENAELKARLLIKQHTKSYIRIPLNWAALGRFFAFLGSLELAIVNFIALTIMWKVLNISVLFGSNEEVLANQALIGWHQLIIVCPLLMMYVGVGLSAVCLAALIKGGFDKLKRYRELGLVFGLVFGLMGGVVVGLVVGLAVGLVYGLLFGLIVGVVVGLIFGLVAGLAVGLLDEFS